MMANERDSKVVVVHGCFPEGGEAARQLTSYIAPLPVVSVDCLMYRPSPAMKTEKLF